MTAPGRHLSDLDLSSFLDGPGSPAETVHLGECDSCQARLDSWRTVRSLIAAPPPAPPADLREAAIAAAMTFAGEPAAGVVVPISAAGSRRSGRRRIIVARAAAAVAAAVAAGGVAYTVAGTGGGGAGNGIHASSEGRNTVPLPSPAGSSASSSAQYAGPAIPGAVEPMAGAAPDLGNVQSEQQLAAALRSLPLKPAQVAGLPCSPVPGPGGARAAGAARLQWRGASAVAFVYQSAGAHQAIVEYTSGCSTAVTVSY